MINNATVIVSETGEIVSVVDVDGTDCIAVAGTVFSGGLPVPSGATTVSIFADNPLLLGAQVNTHDTEYVIPNGETFYLQQVTVSPDGDPTEKGVKVEIIYYDGSTEHVIERAYAANNTTNLHYKNVGTARDTTAVVGDGSTKKIIVRRAKLSACIKEFEAVVRGYTL